VLGKPKGHIPNDLAKNLGLTTEDLKGIKLKGTSRAYVSVIDFEKPKDK
jgi:hypothetical protein